MAAAVHHPKYPKSTHTHAPSLSHIPTHAPESPTSPIPLAPNHPPPPPPAHQTNTHTCQSSTASQPSSRVSTRYPAAFRVQALGLWFRVWGLGFRVLFVALRVEGLGPKLTASRRACNSTSLLPSRRMSVSLWGYSTCHRLGFRVSGSGFGARG
jgi:hypothetical protein